MGSALAVAAKELVESFRDKQTLLYTFVLPVCMYPAMFWVMVQGVLVVEGQKAARSIEVAVHAGDPEAEALAVEALTDGTGHTEGGRGTVTARPLGTGPPDDDSARAALSAGTGAPDVVLSIPGTLSAPEPARLYYDSTDSSSSTAKERVGRRLGQWAEELREDAVRALEPPIDPDALDPILVESRSVAEKSDEGALLLSMMLPILLVVMTVLGAFFPAVDLTAGEKERRTAETTMLLPVPRTAVHLGKILAVCATAMIATVLNLLAIALSAEHLLGQLSGATGGEVALKLPVAAVLSVLPLAVLFAFFVSAALTGVASLAASFKEGQALLGPVQMLFIFPAMAASLPGLSLTHGTAAIPVVNVGLAFRGLLVGDAASGPLLTCAAALLVYAVLAIAFAVRLRSSESVALAGETLSVKRMIHALTAREGQR